MRSDRDIRERGPSRRQRRWHPALSGVAVFIAVFCTYVVWFVLVDFLTPTLRALFIVGVITPLPLLLGAVVSLARRGYRVVAAAALGAGLCAAILLSFAVWVTEAFSSIS
jgi:hypothetical protein